MNTSILAFLEALQNAMHFMEFKKFLFKNKVPGTAAAFSIGSVTAAFLANLTQMMVIPAINKCTFGYIGTYDTFNLLGVFDAAITWIVTLVFTFFFIEYVFARMVGGVSLTVLKHDEAVDLALAINKAKGPEDATDETSILQSQYSGITADRRVM